jgi:hypothetical protein
MKKRLMITLDEELYNFLNENYTNKSALIESLVRAKYHIYADALHKSSDKKEVNTQVCINPEDEVMRVLEETLYV